MDSLNGSAPCPVTRQYILCNGRMRWYGQSDVHIHGQAGLGVVALPASQLMQLNEGLGVLVINLKHSHPLARPVQCSLTAVCLYACTSGRGGRCPGMYSGSWLGCDSVTSSCSALWTSPSSSSSTSWTRAVSDNQREHHCRVNLCGIEPTCRPGFVYALMEMSSKRLQIKT